MTSNKLSEGVGKKIVEALKKQSEIEINAIPSEEIQEETMDFDLMNEGLDSFMIQDEEESQIVEVEENDFLDNLANQSFDSNEELEESDLDLLSEDTEDFIAEEPIKIEEPAFVQSEKPAPTFTNYQQSAPSIADNFVSELDNFEIPSNIAVLKKLISQLPAGVTRHTGAQIIRQTMEALGISMKSVLQEAQQAQEGLNNSAKECQASIQEYKKQIISLEKQSQNHQKQYAALNELISLFIQTGRS